MPGTRVMAVTKMDKNFCSLEADLMEGNRQLNDKLVMYVMCWMMATTTERNEAGEGIRSILCRCSFKSKG